MLLKIFCLTFDSIRGGFDETEFRNFLKDQEIISIRDHLFIKNEIPYLTLVVKYYPFRQEAAQPIQKVGKEARNEDWRKLLTDADMGLFNLLRAWRSKRCKQEGVPPYILMTNLQLAQIVKSRPQALADLMKIDGIGKGKAEKYGQDVLEITKVPEAQPELIK